MRVSHSGGDIELELGVPLNVFITNFDSLDLTHSDERLVQNVVEYGIEGLFDVQKKYLLSIEDGLLNLLEVLRVLHISDFKFRIFHFLDPLQGLSLGIDIENPTKTLGDEATILSGERVSGKTLLLPDTGLSFRSHE